MPVETEESRDFQGSGVERLKANVGRQFRNGLPGLGVVASQEHDRFEAAIVRIAGIRKKFSNP